jgi:hypothetical protein
MPGIIALFLAFFGVSFHHRMRPPMHAFEACMLTFSLAALRLRGASPTIRRFFTQQVARKWPSSI